jgi:hypothetical protein
MRTIFSCGIRPASFAVATAGLQTNRNGWFGDPGHILARPDRESGSRTIDSGANRRPPSDLIQESRGLCRLGARIACVF